MTDSTHEVHTITDTGIIVLKSFVEHHGVEFGTRILNYIMKIAFEHDLNMNGFVLESGGDSRAGVAYNTITGEGWFISNLKDLEEFEIDWKFAIAHEMGHVSDYLDFTLLCAGKEAFFNGKRVEDIGNDHSDPIVYATQPHEASANAFAYVHITEEFGGDVFDKFSEDIVWGEVDKLMGILYNVGKETHERESNVA